MLSKLMIRTMRFQAEGKEMPSTQAFVWWTEHLKDFVLNNQVIFLIWPDQSQSAADESCVFYEGVSMTEYCYEASS